jgi:hypothetical protein
MLVALATALISVFSPKTSCADTLPFGVVGSPIDLSANVSESILPGHIIFQDSKAVFGATVLPVFKGTLESDSAMKGTITASDTAGNNTITGTFNAKRQ